jgi:hypothetical protein
MDAPYPWVLKQRIKSRLGHLSNIAAGGLIEELSAAGENKLKFIVAAHLSEKSNHPEVVREVLIGAWKRGGSMHQPQFVISEASRSTELFRLVPEDMQQVIHYDTALYTS